MNTTTRTKSQRGPTTSTLNPNPRDRDPDRCQYRRTLSIGRLQFRRNLQSVVRNLAEITRDSQRESIAAEGPCYGPNEIWREVFGNPELDENLESFRERRILIASPADHRPDLQCSRNGSEAASRVRARFTAKLYRFPGVRAGPGKSRCQRHQPLIRASLT